MFLSLQLLEQLVSLLASSLNYMAAMLLEVPAQTKRYLFVGFKSEFKI